MKFIRQLYLRKRLFIILAVIASLFVISFFLPHLSPFPTAGLAGLIIALVVDIAMLYSRNGVFAQRLTGERFSNGDQNLVRVFL